ncbi:MULTISPECIES: iron chelate uptake ABC transporter family permease subunit [unclassified Vibrio]|uniref:FecCD family ABC transporter permease n=1 Tax=Vibrio sp. HB236076 TaxID=3232307 RepID=A0AB39HEL4_9VIBR|nr:iron chelate uptake ABC transporter family permease subunit [Vibrio sp. HB161653]MDP5253790.1 iron chelate uptake ABC transporter family permease subunit [Vibrio sp. HB161653]
MKQPLPLSDSLLVLGSWRFLYQKRSIVFGLISLAIVFVLMAYNMTLGSYPLALNTVFSTLMEPNGADIAHRIVWQIRLPRVVTALFVGAALGVSGCVFQSISKNALGSPDVIGFTTGAATGALLQIVLFGGQVLMVAIATILGGVLTAAAVYGLARKNGGVNGYRLILIGIGVGAMLSALNGLLLVKGDLDNAISANLWLAGSLQARTWSHAWPVVVGVMVLVPWVKGLSRALSYLEMGDELAQQAGISVEKVRRWAMLLAVLLAALATASAGPIAFIALAAPQLASRIVRSGQLAVISSACLGALLLLLADTLTQWQPWHWVLPIGRVTGMIGGMYLLWLLVKMK